MNSRALEAEILSQMEAIIAGAGIGYRLRKPPAGADLLVEIQAPQGKPVPVVIEVCANPRRAPVHQAAEKAKHFGKKLGAIPAVGLPRLGPGLKQLLRELDVGYVSLDGQIYLGGEGILINRDVPSSDDRLPWVGESSLFADKSSLLLRYLLSRPAAPVRVREVASELGISLGLVSRLASQLRANGHLVEEAGFGRLVERDALLDDWREFYRRRAKRQHERRMYLHARDIEAVMARLASGPRGGDLPRWGLSYHAGASLVAPYAFFSEAHVLLEGAPWNDAAARFSHALELEPAKAEANVILVQPYYRQSWHYGLREIDGLPVVSDVQLFLDLSIYPRRGAEQASRIQERIVAVESKGPA